MPRALELAASQLWLMLPAALDNLLTISDRMGDPMALETKRGERLENTRQVTLRNGVAAYAANGSTARFPTASPTGKSSRQAIGRPSPAAKNLCF